MSSSIESKLIRILFLLFLIAPAFFYGGVTPEGTAFLKLSLLFMVALWLAQMVRSGEVKLVGHVALIPGVLFCVWATVTALWSPCDDLAEDRLSMIWSCFVVTVICLSFIDSGERIRRVIIGMLMAGLVLSLLHLFQMNASGKFGRLILPVFDVGTGLGTFLNLLILASIGLLLATQSNVLKLWLLTSIVLTTGALLYSMSTAATLSLPVGLLFMSMVLYLARMRRTGFRIFLLLLPTLLPLLILGFSPILQELIKDLGPSSLSMEGRLSIYKSTLRMIGDHPLGVGAGGFRLLFPLYAGPMRDQRVNWAHSEWIEMAADYGLPGVFLLGVSLALLLGKTLSVLVKRRDKSAIFLSAGILGAVAATAFNVLLDHMFHVPAVAFLFFACVGLLANAHRVKISREGWDHEVPGIRRPLHGVGRVAAGMVFLALGPVALWVMAPARAERAAKTSRDLEQQFLWEEASAALERAIALNPNDPTLHNSLGLLLGKRSLYALETSDILASQALERFDKAIELCPLNRGEYWNAKGLLLARRSEGGSTDPAALQALEMAVQQDPHKCFFKKDLSDVLWRCGQREQALSLLKQALIDRPELLQEYVSDCLARGMSVQSLQDLASETTGDQVALAETLWSLDRKEEAVRLIEAVTEKDPSWDNLGLLRDRAGLIGDFDLALYAACSMVSMDTGSGEALMELGHLLMQKGDSAQAIEEYMKAIHLPTSRTEWSIKLAEAYLARGQVEEGVQLCQEIIRLYPGMAEAYMVLARHEMAQERVSDALVHYREALKIEPDRLPWCWEVAKVYGKMKMDFEEMDMWEDCLQKDPSCVNAYVQLGALHERLGEFKAARDLYQAGLRETESNPTLAARWAAIRDKPDAVKKEKPPRSSPQQILGTEGRNPSSQNAMQDWNRKVP